MADRVTFQAEVNDYTKGAIVDTLKLEIGSRDGRVYIRLVDTDAMKLVGEMTAPQAQAMVEGLRDAIKNVE